MSTPSNAEDADLAAKNARLLAAAKKVCLRDWTGVDRATIATIEELRRATDAFGYIEYKDGR